MSLYELFLKCITIDYCQIGKSANYAIFKQGDIVYIFFEGSVGVYDWLKNLNFPAKPYKNMSNGKWYAHRGFLKAWKEIEPRLKKIVLDKSIKKIVISGFSHGAAIAVLCHEYIWYNRLDLRKSLYGYGFGCPRVIWGVKTEEIKCRWKNFTVIKNIDDIVTHVPPKFFGFIHVGRMIKIGQKKKYSCIQAHYPANILKELKIYENENVQNYKFKTVQTLHRLTKTCQKF